MARPSSARGTPHSLAPKSSPHSIQPIRLKRNVRFGGRRTTIVLEPYVWESIDVVLTREQQSLDEFCELVNRTRIHSSLASAARMVVLAYFRILDGLHRPPFYDAENALAGVLREPDDVVDMLSVLPLALRRFGQDEERG